MTEFGEVAAKLVPEDACADECMIAQGERLARAIKLAVESALEEAANYVSQHDNCGDLASKEIRDLILEPAEIESEMLRRLEAENGE